MNRKTAQKPAGLDCNIPSLHREKNAQIHNQPRNKAIRIVSFLSLSMFVHWLTEIEHIVSDDMYTILYWLASIIITDSFIKLYLK